MNSYRELLEHIINHGEHHDDRTGTGTTSVFGYQFRHHMKDGFPLLTTKKLPFRWIVEELRWFLSGSTDERELRAAGVDIWKEWATEEMCAEFGRAEGDLGPVYGWLWRNFGGTYTPIDAIIPAVHNPPDGVDQIKRLLEEIEDNALSRRHIVTGWDPRECDNVALPPCHTLWQIKVHYNGGMSLHLYQRSCDAFLGLPFNIASYALLLTLIGKATGYTPKDLVISFGDLHVYNNHRKQVEEQLRRTPKPLPLLYLDLPLGNTPLERLLSFRADHCRLEGYDPWPKITAPVAV